MKVGSRVMWVTASSVRGSGEVIMLQGDQKHAWIAVDAPPGEEHRVIYCTLTWLAIDDNE